MHAWLIGSRAWFSDYEDHLHRDWDLIVTKRNFIEMLQAPGSEFLCSGIYYGSIKDGKFRIFTNCPRAIEVEIEDRYKSNKLLKHLQASPGITQMADLSANWKLRLEPISKIACAVLKRSHIFFPINWRKNALQLAQMKDSLKNDSLNELVSKEKRKVELNQLFDARSRETLVRISRDVKITKVTLNNELIFNWDKSVLNKFVADNESDTDYFPTTDSRVSKTKFHASSQEDKHKLIDDQLQLIALLYFGNNAHLSAKEIYLLSLETFCCQQIARQPSAHHKWFKRTELVYYPDNYYCSVEDGRKPTTDVLEAIQKDFPNDEAELASDEEVAKSTLGNSVIQWLVDNWCMKLVTPSQQFIEFVSQCVSVGVPLPTLPKEILTVIFNKASDHLALVAISSLNKHFRTSTFNTNDQWKELVSFIWGSKAVDYGTNVSSNSGQWRKVFQELYREAKAGPFVHCNHCQGIHSVLSDPPCSEDRPEWEWNYCACPECDVGSWMECDYRHEFMYCT